VAAGLGVGELCGLANLGLKPMTDAGDGALGSCGRWPGRSCWPTAVCGGGEGRGGPPRCGDLV
jgi:hypothetical protein